MKKLLIFLSVLLIIFGIYQYRLYSYIQKPETGWEYAVEYDLKSEPSYKGTIYVYSDKLINTNSSLGANQNGTIGEYTKTVYMYNSGLDTDILLDEPEATKTSASEVVDLLDSETHIETVEDEVENYYPNVKVIYKDGTNESINVLENFFRVMKKADRTEQKITYVRSLFGISFYYSK